MGMTLMRLIASPTLILTNREAKEAKLKDFIAEDLAARKAGARDGAPLRYTVVARAHDSVVAHVLKGAAADIHAAGLAIAVVLFESETYFEETAPSASLLDVADIECRFLRDQRFAAAHEQLVLNTGRVWIGDCMRRDPSKRDAFELFHADNTPAALHASLSFNRLWDLAKPDQRMAGASSIAPGFLLAGETEQPAQRPASARR